MPVFLSQDFHLKYGENEILSSRPLFPRQTRTACSVPECAAPGPSRSSLLRRPRRASNGRMKESCISRQEPPAASAGNGLVKRANNGSTTTSAFPCHHPDPSESVSTMPARGRMKTVLRSDERASPTMLPARHPADCSIGFSVLHRPRMTSRLFSPRNSLSSSYGALLNERGAITIETRRP